MLSSIIVSSSGLTEFGLGTAAAAIRCTAIGPQIGLPARHALETQCDRGSLAVAAARLRVKIGIPVLRAREDVSKFAKRGHTASLRCQRPPVDRGGHLLRGGQEARLRPPQVDIIKDQGVEPELVQEKKRNATKQMAVSRESKRGTAVKLAITIKFGSAQPYSGHHFTRQCRQYGYFRLRRRMNVDAFDRQQAIEVMTDRMRRQFV
ncbi:hypothetical protein [Bradyrhizobium sp. LHD-71]|uniref:hypothetical protein n=1 Tax=Bradyrhizobium sp. LHD-71 TaxID=3072141 RepID=UPI00280C7C42|nr:hypothetical protein [Bradyrhizobium sp. LHD-71]MDQ8726589.1 hypothetical protein [Bradyrhizobium sp. LHD-71]